MGYQVPDPHSAEYNRYTADKVRENLENYCMQEIFDKIATAAKKGRYSVNINSDVIDAVDKLYLRRLGYKIKKPFGAINYYTIKW